MIDLLGAYLKTALSTPQSWEFYVLYIIIGIAPSLIWLWFYLKQDKHPEPKAELIIVFLLGAFITAPTLYLEIFLTYDCGALSGADCTPGLFGRFGLPRWAVFLLSSFVGIALVEEFAKYAVVWLKEQAISSSRQLDEPMDFIVYMITSAMGFAAAENLLYLLQYNNLQSILDISIMRAITAIFIHSLCSGILGYYLAMTFCHYENRLKFLFGGLIWAGSLHGIYNLFIMGSRVNIEMLFLLMVLILAMSCLLFAKIRKLKKMKSVCSMKI